ncbi:prepilin-type N-terminal cleavage/methylation domain-containing protein [bacterium]|nr:prepilin-type N-terminal cleavage/methylation domain-containing protein [bacterium]
MRTSNRGFSLVELLTVIAIIAILAAVIFPVMGVVKEKARQNNCMTSLHQIGSAVAMFKTDNRKYPLALVGAVDSNGEPTEEQKSAVDFTVAKSDDYLFMEYVPSFKTFHCPSSNITDTKSIFSVPQVAYANSPTISIYVYSSYDGYVDSGGTVYRHYFTDWASETDNSTTGVSRLKPDEGTDDTTKQQTDYERQLKFRNPPADTVITWCSYHQGGTATAPTGNAIVLFLDGSTERVPASKVEACKWRVRPTKG